ncbi:Xylotriose lipo-binding protein, ABC transporter, solute-binding protein [Thermobacillus xylanilyticus]|jgi:raffinose/stachyose/melibiose transport system substrate-binding protein|uniref:Xylotriose lipo-binding protein, ABC transporter, solute-binding protein n=1 Tax=Thermobacillus xylanilyticus TaxID=76633 RepID=A0ABN7RV78_THEXY|nr:extracellular solute-binding protein [Thermobacillus xylanilyticus]REJ11495.1 MAG: ABC transporter substrate-binding protein [Paenibacillaceae bacterium]CAG5086749.1 Xylotriose lipo-binding protein, ABC transporter, solute-binding protein [Thermobacillus xylanilyticus]
MKRKTLAFMLLFAALTWVLAACGGSGKDSGGGNGSGPENSGASSEASSRETSPGGEVTLNLMHLWPEGSNFAQYKIVSSIVEQFQQENENIKISVEVLDNEQYKDKLKVLSASNSLPDIGFTWAAGFMEPYVKGNEFAPLNDLLEGELKGQFVAGTTEGYTFDGTTYALPVELNIVPVFYNKAIFAEYGLEVPKTYEDLKEIIQTLNNNGVNPVALGGKDAWTASFWYMYFADRLGGDNLMDEAVANEDFTAPELREAAVYAQELVDMNAFLKGFVGLSNEEAKAEFMNENAAMYMMGAWEVPNYTTNPDVPQEFKDKIGFFKFPVMEDGRGNVNNWVGGPGVGLFVSENSKHKEEAKKFVSYFVQKWGEISVSEAGVIPATKVDTNAVSLPQMYIDLLNELNNANKVTLYLDVQMKPVASEEHHNLIQALFSKDITPDEFISRQDAVLKEGK